MIAIQLCDSHACSAFPLLANRCLFMYLVVAAVSSILCFNVCIVSCVELTDLPESVVLYTQNSLHDLLEIVLCAHNII